MALPWLAVDSASFLGPLQQAVLEVVVGAHPWRVVGMEAADKRIEALIAHHPDGVIRGRNQAGIHWGKPHWPHG